MPAEFEVYLLRDSLPTREAWNQKLHEMEFDLQLAEGFDPAETSGPVEARSEVHGSAGFDYSLAELDEEEAAAVSLAEVPPDVRAWFSAEDQDQLDAALACAVALVRCCGGVLIGPSGDQAYLDDEHLEAALDDVPEGMDRGD